MSAEIPMESLYTCDERLQGWKEDEVRDACDHR